VITCKEGFMGLLSKSLQQNANEGKLTCSECNKRINAKQIRLLFRNGRVTPVCDECYKDPETICFACKKKIDGPKKALIVINKDQGRQVMTTVCKECCKKEGIKILDSASSSSKKLDDFTVIRSFFQIFWILLGFSSIAEGIVFFRKKKCNDNFTREDILKGWINIIIGGFLFLLWSGGIFSVYFFII